MNGKSVVGQLALLVGLVFFAVGAIVWTNRNPQPAADSGSSAPTPVQVSLVARSGPDTLLSTLLRGYGPMTALEALELAADEEQMALGIREYSFGRLVVSIGGVTSGPGGDWTYMVNGELPGVGAGSCVLATGDRVEFIYGPPPDSLSP